MAAHIRILRRWHHFARGVALVLGANLWLSLALLPVVFTESAPLWLVLWGCMSVLVLLCGVAFRSDPLLLVAFPAALLLPVVVLPELGASLMTSGFRFLLHGASLLAYLFSAALLTSFREPLTPKSARLLSSARRGPSPVWSQRARIYRLLTLLSVVVPGVLFAWINFDDGVSAFLSRTYPGWDQPMGVLMNLVCGLFWIFLYHEVWLGILRPHRTGDRTLVAELDDIRSELSARKPRPQFYFSIAIALCAIGAALAFRTLWSVP